MARLTVLLKKIGGREPGEVVAVREDTAEWSDSSRLDFLPVEVDGPVSAWEHLTHAQYAPRKKTLDPTEEAERKKIYDAAMLQFTEEPVDDAKLKVKRLIGYDDDFEDDLDNVWHETAVTKQRRYFIDTTKLARAVRENMQERIPLIAARNVAHRRVAAGRHALGAVTTMVEARAVWNDGFSWRNPDDALATTYPKGLKTYIAEYLAAVAALKAKEIPAVQLPSSVVDGKGASALVIDRGEGVVAVR